MNQSPNFQQFAPALAGAATPPVPVRTGGSGEKGRPEPDTGQPFQTTPLEKWTKLAIRRKANETQGRYLYRIAKHAPTVEDRHISLKAAASMHFCNARQIVEKKGAEYTPVGSWNCGKKYCAVCSNKKRVKLLGLFSDYFDSAPGMEILKDFDLALFTVTLQHTKDGLRAAPYYKELSTHFRNALKYGAFKKVIAGGFYNTEHTYTKNGHHIHRHALILIPKKFDVFNDYLNLETQLREQWKSRTGGSFQIDLRPLGFDRKNNTATPRGAVLKHIKTHLLEITKYITKRDNSGLIDWNIIKAVEQNSRSKFYGRFGILHKVKELNLNQERENVVVDESPEPRQLFTCNIYVKFQKDYFSRTATRRKITPHRINNIPAQKITVVKGETIISWKKSGISYTCKNLAPFDDTAEGRRNFKKQIALDSFRWRCEKYDKLREGYTVKTWKQNREALKRWNNTAPAVPIIYTQTAAPF